MVGRDSNVECWMATVSSGHQRDNGGLHALGIEVGSQGRGMRMAAASKALSCCVLESSQIVVCVVGRQSIECAAAAGRV